MAGVISAARYTSVAGNPKYLALYWAESLEVFSGPAYSQAFKQQTQWSMATMNKMRAPMRRVGTVKAHAGQGTGGWVATMPLAGDDFSELDSRCTAVARRLAEDISFVQSYVLLPDDELSRPLPHEDMAKRQMNPLLIIESRTSVSNAAAADLAASLFNVEGDRIARYQLNWKLASEELR